jgi:hypothetical protein
LIGSTSSPHLENCPALMIIILNAQKSKRWDMARKIVYTYPTKAQLTAELGDIARGM